VVILLVTARVPYLPCTDGYRLIPANLIRRLSSKHEIHLVSFTVNDGSDEDIEFAEKYCRSVSLIPISAHVQIRPNLACRLSPRWRRARLSPGNRDARRVVQKVLHARRYDVIHVESLHAATYFVGACGDVPTLLACHDCQSWRKRQLLSVKGPMVEKLRVWRQWRATRRLERYLLPRVSSTVVVAERDAEILVADNPGVDMHVIHNGVDCEYFQPPAQRICRPTVIFTGNMAYFPNVRTAVTLGRSIFPRIRHAIPDAELLIVGASPEPQVTALGEMDGVTVTGFVNDMRDYLSRAAVYVCPMWIGTGIKNKLLEAMAMGLPVVSTPEACSGLAVADGENVLLATSEDEFVEQTVALLGDYARGDRIGGSGRALVEGEYSWDVAIRRYEELLLSLESGGMLDHGLRGGNG